MYPFVNLPLPYEYDALEPYIDTKTMIIHHDKSLQAYVDRLNEVLKAYPGLQSFTLEELIEGADKLPKVLQAPIRNYAGGVYNHRFFFNGLKIPNRLEPQGNLVEMINAQYGNFNNFKEVFKNEALGLFGSGDAWLVFDKGKLKIMTTPNQNNPLAEGYCPILTIDVWEHAYFLKHYNLRNAYVDDWFRVINWDEANRNFMNCLREYQQNNSTT